MLPKKYFFGKLYKKNFSIYKNEKTYKSQPHKFAVLFHESVEPISLHSWLFIAQFSIGLLVLHILQNISQKYGREMKYVVSSLLEGKNENSLDTNLNENDSHENFRLIQNIKKDFRDIAGIDAILPELSEIVWFLRNSGRSFKIGSTIPRRILLTGPPGTGKTLLIQAIAGEAEVPVLIESGSSLNQSGTSEGGSERLKNIFNKAREIAPCIIFIDEIDTFGQARDQMLGNSSINNEIIDCIYSNDKTSSENTFRVENFDFIPQPTSSAINEMSDSNESSNFQNEGPSGVSNNVFDQVNKKVTQNNLSKHRTTQEKSNLLMQFLIELDGIATEKKILVFGATNRPQILDAALTRPGRFNKVLNLNLPNKQKRIEILKLYSKNLGVDINISWNYLSNLTPGLSAADLASVMNQSSMKAIQAETFHTIETIEYGIESITGYSTQKNQLKSFTQMKEKVEAQLYSSDKFEPSSNSRTFKNQETVSKSIFINRLAYYQAGKAIVHTLLKYHPEVVSVHLWPQLKNPRYHLVNGILEKEFSQIRTRIELESRIIGFYGGKASEFLALFHDFKNSKFSLQETRQNAKSTKSKQTSKHHTFLYAWQSDLGIQDISFAGWLAQLMINKWYLYSKQIAIEKLNQFQNNSNLENILDFGSLELFKQLADEIESEASRETIALRENSQNWITKPWLQRQITKKLEFSYLTKNNWYKIYEGDHEENENTRCIQPDEYYHSNIYLNNLLKNKHKIDQPVSSVTTEKQWEKQDSEKRFFKSSLTWNDLADSNRDYIYHSLILSCFNKSISILDKNRELLDFFTSYLIQKEVIREDEITNIINTFQKNEINLNKQQNTTPLSSISSFTTFFTEQRKNKIKSDNKVKLKKQSKKNTSTSKKKDKILEKNWGKWSRTKPSRFISFENI
jgi:ATP-dependent Zn protease